MTCNELHDYVKSRCVLPRDEDSLSAEFIAHIEDCSACRQWTETWAETEEQLNQHLRLLRDFAPAVPATLDESILIAYRKEMQQSVHAAIPMRKASSAHVMLWRAAIAALLLIGAIILFGNRKAVSPPPTATVHSQPALATTQKETQPTGGTPKPVTVQKNAPRHIHRRAPPFRTESASAQAAGNTLPSDFQNLMYCDELSCSGAMEVIRMDLPASALGLASPLRTSNVVAADVVVGADGVARAIRIVN